MTLIPFGIYLIKYFTIKHLMSTYSDINVDKNQIWLCKKSYTDHNGNLIEGNVEFYVFITNSPERLNDVLFVRVQPISSKIEMKSDEDILISDRICLGYPFIIETWNEQPILINVLGKYIGTISENLPLTSESGSFTELQLEFRKEEIRNSAYLRQSVLSFLEWEEKKVKRIDIKTYSKLLIAAAFVGAIILVWQPSKLTTNKIYNNYNIVYSNNIKIKYGNGEILRGTECLIPGFSVHECEIIQLAFRKYDESDYKNSLTLFEHIDNLKNRDHLIFFYLALSRLYSGDIENSIENLTYLADFKNESFLEDAQYYLALAYIKNKQIIKARRILNSLTTDTGKYSKSSREILRKLRWF